MDEKLHAMKNLIIEDTARYFNQHGDGNLLDAMKKIVNKINMMVCAWIVENLNPSEVKNMRNELADRLATAYSLDKMRKAIARLKSSMALQRTLEKNLLETPSAISEDDDDDDDKKKAKRVAVKKEKVQFDNNE